MAASALPDTYKVAIAETPGQVKIVERPLPKPGKNQVLVKVLFSPINPADYLNNLHLYPVPITPRPLGFEGSGVVAAVGDDLKVPISVGENVHIFNYGLYGQYVLADSETLIPVQSGISLEEAACHFVNPFTVYYMGVLAQQKNANAVVHTAGTSALGRMIIRYFKHLGIKTINVVRRNDFTEELIKEGADYVLNSTDLDFEAKFKEITEKEQATTIFEAIAGPLSGKLLKNAPKNTTLYIYGALSGEGLSGLLPTDFIFEGKTVTGLWLMTFYEELAKKGELRKELEKTLSYLPTFFRSNIQKVFNLEDLTSAFEFYQKHSSQGKILIKPN